MRTVLICHDEDPIGREGLARWLASFSDLGGIVSIQEPAARKWRRIKREVRRVGPVRFLDVLAFRVYYAARLRSADRDWEVRRLAEVQAAYPPLSAATRVLQTPSPNSAESELFIRELAPEIVVARCKTLLAERIFSIPPSGTFVMHPGICPEYRNAHGCFWALVRGDRDNVGMTLLRIDRGIDTGPVFGYFRCAVDEGEVSPIAIQNQVVLDNLDGLRDRLMEVAAGRAEPLDTRGRESAEWGQPWLSSYLAWKARVRRER